MYQKGAALRVLERRSGYYNNFEQGCFDMSTIEKSRIGRRVKGFTLMELIIVIAIIGVLLGILLPTMSAYYWKSRVKTANNMAKMVYNASQTEVQKLMSADRNPGHDSGMEGLMLIQYDEANDNLAFTVTSTETGGVTTYTWPASGTSIEDAVNSTDPNTAAVGRLVRNVNRTVSSASDYNWAIYVENYIVKAAVAAESRNTRNVGYFTKGTITNEQATGNYGDVFDAILTEKAGVYNAP